MFTSPDELVCPPIAGTWNLVVLWHRITCCRRVTHVPRMILLIVLLQYIYIYIWNIAIDTTSVHCDGADHWRPHDIVHHVSICEPSLVCCRGADFTSSFDFPHGQLWIFQYLDDDPVHSSHGPHRETWQRQRPWAITTTTAILTMAIMDIVVHTVVLPPSARIPLLLDAGRGIVQHVWNHSKSDNNNINEKCVPLDTLDPLCLDRPQDNRFSLSSCPMRSGGHLYLSSCLVLLKLFGCYVPHQL